MKKKSKNKYIKISEDTMFMIARAQTATKLKLE
jgi:hypothetical protein